MEGYIWVHRKMLENPIVMKDADHLAVWMYLLLNATHKGYPVVFNGQKMTLKAGQLITGRKKIAEITKVNESKVKRILKTFKNDQQIDQRSCTQNSLITILNWSHYQLGDQPNDQRVTNKWTTSDQRVTTNNNVNNVNNVKNNRKKCLSLYNNYDYESLERELCK